jgi:hypothetical protein
LTFHNEYIIRGLYGLPVLSLVKNQLGIHPLVYAPDLVIRRPIWRIKGDYITNPNS